MPYGVPPVAALGQSGCGDESHRACHVKLKTEHSGTVDLDMDQVLMKIDGDFGLLHGRIVVLTKDMD